VEVLGGAGEVAAVGDGGEVAKLAEFDGGMPIVITKRDGWERNFLLR
jgi:hypothetical protein